MGQSRNVIVLLIVVSAIVGYLWLSQPLMPEAPVSTAPTVPPASVPAPAPAP
jgi:hypothetical protein